MGIYEKIKRLFGWGTPAAPKAAAAEGETATPAPASTAPGGNERRGKDRVNARGGTRILVIDDSPTVVLLLSRMLRQNDYLVLEAGDAETGLQIAREQTPDLIFLDHVLPGMDGFAALRHLRKDPYTREIPIIMISGNEQATEQFYVHRIGADDFMKKPFSRPEVFTRIERLLDAERIPRRFNPAAQASDATDDTARA